MTDANLLNTLIKEESRIKITQQHNKHIAILTEEATAGSSITIRDIPPDTIIIKADSFRSPSSLFKGEKGECKRADYILINEEKKVAIFIEMKKAKGDKKGIGKQLKGALCLFHYCREIGKEFWEKKDFLLNYKLCFVSACHTNIAKRQTRGHKKSSTPTSPENPMRVNGQNYIQFNMIAS